MERKKAKSKMMFKILNNVGPRSLTDLFSYKSEKTEYHLQDISKVSVYQNLELII